MEGVSEQVPDLEHAREERQGWYTHLAIFVVVQSLIQLAFFAGFLAPTDGLFFGNGPKPPIGIGSIQIMPDIAGFRQAWIVVLVMDFLWSFSYTLWPKKRSPK